MESMRGGEEEVGEGVVGERGVERKEKERGGKEGEGEGDEIRMEGEVGARGKGIGAGNVEERGRDNVGVREG